MLVQRVAVRHPGDIVGDQLGGCLGLGSCRPFAPIGRQAFRFGEENLEQLAHHPAGLAGHPIQAVMAIHVGEQELLQRLVVGAHRVRKRGDGRLQGAHLVGRARTRFVDPAAGFGEQVLDHDPDQIAHRRVHQPAALETGVTLADGGEDRPHQRHALEIVHREQLGAQPVLDVVVVVGDIVGDGGNLRLGPGEGVETEIVDFDVFGDGPRQRLVLLFLLRPRPDQRTVVLDHAFQGFPGQVQAVEFRITLFQPGDDAQRLGVVIEAAIGRHDFFQRILAGVTEGRVAEIVG